MRTRTTLALLSFTVAAVWGFLFVRVGRGPGAGPAPHRATVPAVDRGEPEGRAYAPDSVFRPDVDRAEATGVPPEALRASLSFSPEDARPFSYFGHSVALDGDTAVIGAPYDDGQGTDAGAAYVFRRSEAGWRQVARLTAPEAWDFDRFGFSVAVRGRSVAVGADRRDRGEVLDCGAVYVFEERNGSWALRTVFQPEGLGSGDALGISVAVDGTTVLAGAPGQDGSGAAYVFSLEGREEARLAAPASSGYAGFGHSVALSGGTALIGAPTTDDPAVLAGAAYVFQRAGGGWRLEARLASPSPAPLEKLGSSVALHGGLALVGAPRAVFGDSTRAGTAFVFRRSARGWEQAARINAPSPRSDEEFGRAVALDSGHAIIGSGFGDAAGLNTGVAYLFERRGETWVSRGAVFAAEPAAVDEFGTSVAISGARALIGAPRHSRHGNASGAAYVLQDRPAVSPLSGGSL